jgi:hypothetical protein
MPSPLPGMNPYLESPQLWSEFHSRLIVAIADILNPQIMPKYRAAVERQIYEMQSPSSPEIANRSWTYSKPSTMFTIALVLHW